MAKLKYQNSDVDPGQNFDKPFPAGLYAMEIESIEVTESKGEKTAGEAMLKVTLTVKEGDYKGRKVWEYIVQNENSAFRMRQLTDALGAPPDGDIDYNEDTRLVKKIGSKKVEGATIKCNIKIEPGDDQYDPSNKVKNFLKKGAAAEEDGGEAEEEVEEPADEPEPEAASSDDDEYTWDDLKDLDHAELAELVSEWGADTDPDEYDDDTVEEFAKALAEEYDITIPKAKKAKGKKAKAKKEEAPDYSAMDLGELKEACEEKELSPKGTKKVLLKRLEKAAKAASGDDGDPF